MPPAGVRLKDGHPTYIEFALNTNFPLWEVTVTPPGFDAGGPNDTTNMRNVRFRTKQPKKLVTMTAMSGTCHYATVFYDTALDMLGVNQLITTTFSDGSKVKFWGFLDKLTPQESREGTPPIANFTVEASNEDDDGVEAEPIYVGRPSS